MMNAHFGGSESQISIWKNRLLRDGFCVIPDLLPAGRIETLDRDLADDFAETPFCKGGFYGEHTKRFGRLLLRSKVSEELVMHPLVLGVVKAVLGPWCDTVQLNLTQALSIHPGAPSQFPHRDQDMWRGATGETEYLVNVMWPFTPYTADNGTTRLWLASHGRAALDPEPTTDPIPAEMTPGSALLFLGSTLHGAGANVTNEVRRGAIISYCLGWLKPYENQWLAYPPEIARGFEPELAALVGYCQHRPNLGNFEGQCPSILFDEHRPDRIGAIDALRSDQQQVLADFVRDQQGPAKSRPAG